VSYRPPGHDDAVIQLVLVCVVIAVGCAFGLANCVGPCSWIGWEPVSDMPGRCLPGMPK
jgi:hypothetical protein